MQAPCTGVRWPFVLALLAIIPAAAFAAGQANSQQQSLPSAFIDGRSLKVGNGYLVSFDRGLSGAQGSNEIQLSSLANGVERHFGFWIDNASAVWVNDAAVMPGGDVVLAGSWEGSPSRWIFNFLDEMDSAGNLLSAANLGDYEPERICAENDGTIWTLGEVWSEKGTNVSYPVLRNYSLDGTLLHSYLKRRDLPVATFGLSSRIAHVGPPPGKAYLKCGTQSVGVYMGLAWFEVNTTTHGKTWWTAPLPTGGTITGLALLGEHQVYASVGFGSEPGFTSERSSFDRYVLFELYATPGSTAGWRVVSDSPAFPPAGQNSALTLLGSNQGSLVYMESGGPSAESALTLFWAKP